MGRAARWLPDRALDLYSEGRGFKTQLRQSLDPTDSQRKKMGRAARWLPDRALDLRVAGSKPN